MSGAEAITAFTSGIKALGEGAEASGNALAGSEFHSEQSEVTIQPDGTRIEKKAVRDVKFGRKK